MNVVNLGDCPDITLYAGSTSIEIAPLPIFSDEACGFLEDVSRKLLADKRARRYSDVLSFAYWCRKASITREKEQRAGMLECRMGRGLALHIAPSNVPMNFAFSYAFSILAGNATIVRTPSKSFEQVDITLDAFRAAFEGNDAIARRSAFVGYPSAGSTTDYLSRLAAVRVIWGGDVTVGKLRTIQSSPRCIDIAFPDRYSIGVFDAETVSALNEKDAEELARQFFNDTYLMDQNACSTPHTILWKGPHETARKASEVFWSAVSRYAATRYLVQASLVMDKYVQQCEDFINETIDDSRKYGDVLVVSEITEGRPVTTDCRGVGGYFYEMRIDNFADFAENVNAKYQTVTYYGLDPKELRKVVIDEGLVGIDRIVPVGSAMDIGLIWDGYDLISEMSRIVALQ